MRGVRGHLGRRSSRRQLITIVKALTIGCIGYPESRCFQEEQELAINSTITIGLFVGFLPNILALIKILSVFIMRCLIRYYITGT
jgi:hypothetical protein